MKRDARSDAANGVLDAGVVLVRLDRRHRSHQRVADLFDRSADSEVNLLISAVNLAEILEHAREYSRQTGLDVVALLSSYRIGVHSPDVETARRVAHLAGLPDASLADRFALATAEWNGSRLYTTDHPLAAVARKRKVPVTVFER